MFEITRILNHNAIVAVKEKNQYLIMDKGIGFGKKVYDWIDHAPFEAIYLLQEETERGNSENIVERIDPLFLEITHELLKYAQEKLGNIDKNILLPLSDHLAFAVERIKNHLLISNPFVNEIRWMNPDEYEVAKKAAQIIKNKLGYEINEDEIGYITLHLHAASSNEKVDEGMQTAIIINESMKTIEDMFHVHINVQSLAYSRLLMHMKYMLARIKTGETLNLDMDEFVKKNYPLAYEVAENILVRVGRELHHTIPRIEIGYLGLHIQRIYDVNE